MRSTVSICFSGHPRSFLNHTASWDAYFAKIQEEFDLDIYFHSWADAGHVASEGGTYREGSLISGTYDRIQDLVSYLRPAAFAIESFSPELAHKTSSMQPVILSSWQGARKNILSQLYSIYRADTLRQRFEAEQGVTSDVVVRMRFDAVPHAPVINDLRFVARNPDLKILIAPSPAWHGHPGGGGGCVACQEFYTTNADSSDFEEKLTLFLKGHPRHTNDICDLFAAGSSRMMATYTDIYNQVEPLFETIIREVGPAIIEDLLTSPDTSCPIDRRISGTLSGEWDVETSPIFVPEKLIRWQMAGFLVLHGETVVVIQRQ